MSAAKVVGKRSPRWAVWARMTIPCKGGLQYLTRLRIVQTPWFGIYVHDIHEDDGDRCCHNHPWSFISIVLRGSYTERLYPNPMGLVPSEYVLQTHGRFSVHKMGRDTAHRVTYAAPRLKTLILVGPRKATWGFFDNGEFVEWQDYEEKIGTI